LKKANETPGNGNILSSLGVGADMSKHSPYG
jgi:hypothetical protein